MSMATSKQKSPHHYNTIILVGWGDTEDSLEFKREAKEWPALTMLNPRPGEFESRRALAKTVTWDKFDDALRDVSLAGLTIVYVGHGFDDGTILVDRCHRIGLGVLYNKLSPRQKQFLSAVELYCCYSLHCGISLGRAMGGEELELKKVLSGLLSAGASGAITNFVNFLENDILQRDSTDPELVTPYLELAKEAMKAVSDLDGVFQSVGDASTNWKSEVASSLEDWHEELILGPQLGEDPGVGSLDDSWWAEADFGQSLSDTLRGLATIFSSANRIFRRSTNWDPVSVKLAGFGPIPVSWTASAAFRWRSGYCPAPQTSSRFVSGNTPRVVLFNMGQADCCLLQFPVQNGLFTIMIDSGDTPTNDSILPWQRFVEHKNFVVDLLVVTHCDQDHIGGLATAVHGNAGWLNRVRRVWMTSTRPPSSSSRLKMRGEGTTKAANWIKVIEHFAEDKRLVDGPIDGTYGAIQGLRVDVLNPTKDAAESLAKQARKLQNAISKNKQPGMKGIDVNKGSLVLLVSFNVAGDFSDPSKIVTCLITGDAHPRDVASAMTKYGASKNLPKLVAGDSEVFHLSYMDLPHHGSSLLNQRPLFRVCLADCYGWSTGFKYTTMMDWDTIEALDEAHAKYHHQATICVSVAPSGNDDRFDRMVRRFERVWKFKWLTLQWLPQGKRCWIIDLHTPTTSHTNTD